MYTNYSGKHCDRLSHLIYKLHTCVDYKNKLLLSTKIFNFKDELLDSKVSRRVLTSVDPEFIYLLLRSSTIFKLIGLELVNLLVSSQENASHFRKVVVYVTNILKSSWSRNHFECDESTKIISEKIGETEIVWIRLIYQCLECLYKISVYLGPDYIFTYNTQVTELNESVEFLVNDMFDVSIQDSEDKNTRCSVNVKPVGFQESNCMLCGILKNKDFKEEALVLQELYRDLDSLSKAHLEELDMNDLESEAIGGVEANEELIVLPELLNKLSNLFLTEFRDSKEESCLNLFCIELLIKLLPRATKIEFVKKCLDSNNFDIIKVLINAVQSFNSGSKWASRVEKKDLDVIKSMMNKYCIGLMESNLTRENMSFVLNYLKGTLDSTCIDDKSYSNLLKVAKRCEIEIYVELDDVFRKENAAVSSVAFEMMEKVMTTVAEAEEPFETMNEFFAIFHRTIQLLFDYFDNLYDLSEKKTSSAAEKYKVYCLRLLSCWMTLEPMYYQNQFMDKLEKILSVLNEFDLVWLLPTFNFVELSDLDSINRLLELLFKLMIKITKIGSGGEIAEGTLKMTCNLVTRLHLDQMIDYQKMIMKLEIGNFDTGTLSSNPESNFDLKEYIRVLSDNLGKLNTYKPSYPVEFLAPICINLDQTNYLSYELLSSVALELLIKTIEGTDVEFVRNRLESGYDFEAFDEYLRMNIDFDDLENLCYVTEAAASTCLSRVYEGSSLKHMDNQKMVVIMELVVRFFIHTAPRTKSEYLDDVHRMNHYFTLCKLCILLMQNYATFLLLFNYSIKKVCLKIATPPKKDFQTMIQEGFVVEEDLVLCGFFSTYTSNLQ